MDAVMTQDNQELIDRLESFLSNPLQPFDCSLLQEAYNEIIALRKAKEHLLQTVDLLNQSKDSLFITINILGDLNIKLEKQIINLAQKGNTLVEAMSSGSDHNWDKIIDDWKDYIEREIPHE